LTLAIALVVAANMAFAQINPKRKEEDYFVSRNEHLEKIIEMEPPVGLREEDNTTGPSEELKDRVKKNQETLKIKESDEDYFSDLEGYIKYTREEDIENLTYPQFKDKYYPKPPTEINTYGDDDWGTPSELDGGEVEVTVEPTKKQLEDVEKELYLEAQNDIDLKDIENYLTNIEYVEKEEKQYKLKSEKELISELEDTDLERLTDTTQTLIVEDKDDPKKERVLRYDKTNKGRKKV
jgi:hypothetical protein